MFKTPVHLLESPFQKAVWEELRTIAPGQTRSYLQIAESLKKPTACRAVVQANGANQLAIIVPCHRVIIQMVNLVATVEDLLANNGCWNMKKIN